MGDFQLGKWLVQPAAGLLSGQGQERRLEPKTMAVLVVLASAHGAVVARWTLMDKVWADQEVSDDVLTNCISSLRRSLGDDRRNSQFVQTLPKRGYRLLVEVEPILDTDAPGKTTETAPPIPQSRQQQKRYWVVLLLAIFTAVTSTMWQWQDRQATTPPEFRSIAVLPFDVYSDRLDARHFADGLAEELIHQLTTDPDLRVIARTSSFMFRDQGHGIGEIAEALKVRHVLEGSVRDSDNGMRITIQLIDTSNESHLWSRVFDVGRDNALDVQQQVGLAVSKLIPTDAQAIETAGPARHPVAAEAYRLYLMGQSHMRVATVDAYAKAAVFFADAIRIEPDYALAHTQLAAAYLLLYQYRHDPLEQATGRARSALENALEIDPRQAEAFAVFGLLHTYRKDYAAAEESFMQAIALQPNLSFARHNYGFMLWSQSRFQDALEQLRIALDSNPLSGVTHFLLADSLAGLGRFEPALQAYQMCQQKLPEYYSCFAGLATIEQLMGNYEAAAESLDHAGTLVSAGNFWQDSVMAALAIRQGHEAQAAELLQRASEQSPLNYNLLKSRLLISIHAGELALFVEELSLLRERHSNDHDLELISAMAYFLSSDCTAALAIYTRELETSQAFLFDYWDLGDGFSHATSLAFCYDKMDLIEKRNGLLERIRQHIAAPELPDFPGRLYQQARYYRMIGRPDQSQQLLTKLAENQWPLLWLAATDPVFSGVESNDPEFGP